MKEDKKKRQDDSTKPTKKKESMRESAAKSRQQSEKPRRVRQAAGVAKRPVSSFSKALTSEYHLFRNDESEEAGFFSKSRKITPNYLRNAWNELRQVTWPGRKETWRLVMAVFIFAILLGAVIAILDFGLEKIMREIIL